MSFSRSSVASLMNRSFYKHSTRESLFLYCIVVFSSVQSALCLVCVSALFEGFSLLFCCCFLFASLFFSSFLCFPFFLFLFCLSPRPAFDPAFCCVSFLFVSTVLLALSTLHVACTSFTPACSFSSLLSSSLDVSFFRSHHRPSFLPVRLTDAFLHPAASRVVLVVVCFY